MQSPDKPGVALSVVFASGVHGNADVDFDATHLSHRMYSTATVSRKPRTTCEANAGDFDSFNATVHANKGRVPSFGMQIHHATADADAYCAGHGGDGTPCPACCLYSKAKQVCVAKHEALFWARADDPVYSWVTLEADPTSALQDLTLTTTSSTGPGGLPQQDNQWGLGGQRLFTQYNVPDLTKQNLTTAVRVWSTLEQLPPIGNDPFNPWSSSALVRMAGVQANDNICKENGAFADVESGVTYEAALGTRPYGADIANLTGTATRIASFKRDPTTLVDAPTTQLQPCLTTCQAPYADGSCAATAATAAEVSQFAIKFSNLKLSPGEWENTSEFGPIQELLTSADIFRGDDFDASELIKADNASQSEGSVLAPKSYYKPNAYYVTVVATNAAGVKVSSVSSGLTIDVSTPTFADPDGSDCAADKMPASSSGMPDWTSVDSDNNCGKDATVYDASWLAASGEPHKVEVQWQSSLTDVSALWAATDAESGVASYEWAIGTTAGATDVQGWAAVGTATSATRTGLALQATGQYCASVRATNGAGLKAVSMSRCVAIDTTAPEPVAADAALEWLGGAPLPSLATDAVYGWVTDKLHIKMPAVQDLESGVEMVEVTIGTKPTISQDVLPWMPIGNTAGAEVRIEGSAVTLISGDQSSAYKLSELMMLLKEVPPSYRLQLEAGRYYYASYRVTNKAHTSVVYTSKPFIALGPKASSKLLQCGDASGEQEVATGSDGVVVSVDTSASFDSADGSCNQGVLVGSVGQAPDDSLVDGYKPSVVNPAATSSTVERKLHDRFQKMLGSVCFWLIINNPPPPLLIACLEFPLYHPVRHDWIGIGPVP